MKNTLLSFIKFLWKRNSLYASLLVMDLVHNYFTKKASRDLGLYMVEIAKLESFKWRQQEK